jgi:hypothetical protein
MRKIEFVSGFMIVLLFAFQAFGQSGNQIINISGEWEGSVENLNAFSRYGTFTQIVNITQSGTSFSGIRMKDNPPPSYGKAGSKCMEGEVDKNGIKKIEWIGGTGKRLPAVCRISENGKKMDIDAFDSVLPTHSQLVRVALLRK